MPPSDLYLIRHAQSEWNAAGRWQGQADPPLSPVGVNQARVLAAHFPDVEVSRVVCSDLVRARETAAAFAARFGIELEVDPALRELDVGSWSGKTRDEIEAEQPGALSAYYHGVAGWTGGETYEQHEARCEEVALRIAESDVDGTVVVVTHGGTIRAMLRTLLEIPHTDRWRISGPSHTTISHVARGMHGWRLVTFNGSIALEDA